MPGSFKCSPSLRNSHQNPVCTFPLPRPCYMSCLSQSSWLDHPNDIWRGVQSIIPSHRLWLLSLTKLCWCYVYPEQLIGRTHPLSASSLSKCFNDVNKKLACNWASSVSFRWDYFNGHFAQELHMHLCVCFKHNLIADKHWENCWSHQCRTHTVLLYIMTLMWNLTFGFWIKETIPYFAIYYNPLYNVRFSVSWDIIQVYKTKTFLKLFLFQSLILYN
jgi:hypothetical protein